MRRVMVLSMAAATLSACSSGDGREIRIGMFEMGFEPARVDVTAGETVTFVVENDGAATHELFIGEEAAQDAREAQLADGETPPDPDSVILRPGETGEIEYTFGDAGEVLIGCHVVGHYAAGMVGTVTISVAAS